MYAPLESSTSKTDYKNAITFNSDGSVDIISGGAYLRYNANSDQTRFRYYSSSKYSKQKAIQLYKLYDTTSDHTHNNWNSNWSSDDDYHWVACNECDVVKDKAKHDWKTDASVTPSSSNKIAQKCSICGKTREIDKLQYEDSIDLTAQGWTNGKSITDLLKLEKNGVTIKFSKASYYTSGNAVRVYGGSTVTLTAPFFVSSI